MTATGDDALVGRVLNGRYAVGKRIARGGMASVFMATDTRLDRVVAVKIMHAGLADDSQFTERFVREARIAAQLNHPNVVSVFDQGTDADVTYLVMEYVPGETLRDVMRKEAPMPPSRALALLEQVLVALSAAHAAQMIHRDVKPENVLITPDGVTKVADFGLARAVTAATTATGGTLIGTVSYLAPEIVVNEGADPRSDVYACGAILYEMLTGFKPHGGDSPIQIAYKHVHEDIPKPSASVSGVPPYVDALVERATARNRDHRSADALVLLQQVRLVRRAIDAGVADDPELTRDLLPNFDNSSYSGSLDETTGSMPAVRDHDDTQHTVVVTEAPASAAVGSGTQVLSDGQSAWVEPPEVIDGPEIPEDVPPPKPPKSSRSQKTKGDPKKRRGLVFLLILLVIALIAALGGWYYGIGRYVDAPNLVGMSQEDAVQLINADGFTLGEVEREINEDEPPGTVLSTSPSAGEPILPGGTIHLVVSRGKSEYAVSDVENMSVDDAITQIESETEGTVTVAFDDNVVEREFHEEIDEDLVIRIDGVEPGDVVENGATLYLVVSKGREPIPVPSDLRGMTENEARDIVSDAGLEPTVAREFSDDVEEGRVIRTRPASGETRFRGDEVELIISRGPEFREVPCRQRARGDEAAQALEDAGFEVEFDGNESNWVLSCSPTGSQRFGTTITLTMFP